MGGVEMHHKEFGCRFLRRQPPQFLKPRQQPVDSQRGPHSGQRLLRVETGQIVVAATGTDAAERREFVEKTLQHDPCVVVEAAGDRRIDHHPSLRHARLPHAVEQAPQRGYSGAAGLG